MGIISRMRHTFPEAIPMPGAIIYNAIPAKILREPEKVVAQEVVSRVESGILVDLGSGTCYLAIEIARMASKLQVYGIDLSKTMVKIARKYAQTVKNVQFKLCNAAALPFGDDSIDFIVSTGSLHHWRRPARVLNECYRVLKNGKEAWIYDGCPPDILKEAGEVVKKYGIWRYQVLRRLVTIHGFTKQEYESEIKSVLEETKFKDSYRMEQTDFWMRIVARKHVEA